MIKSVFESKEPFLIFICHPANIDDGGAFLIVVAQTFRYCITLTCELLQWLQAHFLHQDPMPFLLVTPLWVHLRPCPSLDSIPAWWSCFLYIPWWNGIARQCVSSLHRIEDFEPVQSYLDCHCRDHPLLCSFSTLSAIVVSRLLPSLHLQLPYTQLLLKMLPPWTLPWIVSSLLRQPE